MTSCFWNPACVYTGSHAPRDVVPPVSPCVYSGDLMLMALWHWGELRAWWPVFVRVLATPVSNYQIRNTNGSQCLGVGDWSSYHMLECINLNVGMWQCIVSRSRLADSKLRSISAILDRHKTMFTFSATALGQNIFHWPTCTDNATYNHTFSINYECPMK